MDTALQAARRAGDVIIRNLGRISHKDISLKQSSDFVTRVDKEAESIILSTIRARFPEHSFLAEETEKSPETGNYRWIIDPLDGTTNYAHQLGLFAVSIAFALNDEIIIGVVLNPLSGELFVAAQGHGATLNGRPIDIPTRLC